MREAVQPLELAFPLGGVSEALTFEDQAPATAEDAANMRGLDPRTRRYRGAKRCGSKRWLAATLGSRVQRGITLTHQNKLSDYTEQASGSEPVKWTEFANDPQEVRVVAMRRDWEENVIALQEDGVLVKFNSDGKKKWDFKVPMQGQGAIARALEVDPILGLIFVGVSESDQQKKAQLFCIQEREPALDENEEEELVPKVVWDLNLDLFFERIRSRGAYLVLGCNDERRRKSYVVTLLGKDTEDPIEQQRFEVAYPLYGMDVKKNGEVYTTSPRFDDRYMSTYQSECRHSIVVGTPDVFIDKWSDRVWSWHKADDFDGAGNVGLNDFDRIAPWRDVSGRGRHLYQDGSLPRPFLRLPGFNGMPSVEFQSDGLGAATGTTVLRSSANWTVVAGQPDAERTIIPGYTAANWAVFMVIRPMQQGSVGCLLSQDSNHATNGVRAIAANQGDAVYPTAGAGFLRFVEPANGDGNSAGLGVGWTNLYQYSTASQRVVIVSWIVSAGAPPWPAGSRIRCNGAVIDDYTAIGMTSSGDPQSTWVGGFGGTPNGYNGEIMEMIVLREDLTAVPALPKVTDAEISAIEGYLGWKYGVQHVLPGGHTYRLTAGPPMAKKGAGVAPAWAELMLPGQQLVKWSPSGRPLWVLNDVAGTNGQQALGYDVRVWEQKGKNTRIYTVGPKATLGTGASLFHAAAWTDSASGLPVVNFWRATLSSSDWDYIHPQIDVDGFGSVHIGRAFPVGTSTAQLYSNDAGAPSPHEPDDLPDIPSAAQKPRVLCVAAGRMTEYYDQSINFNEYVVCGDDVGRLHRVDYVLSAPAAVGGIRHFVDIAIIGGELNEFDTAAFTPLNGSPAFDTAASNYYDMVVMANEVVVSDGNSYKVFNPLRSPYWQPGDALIAGGQCEDFVAKKGKIPPRGALLANYRGRLIVARQAEDPAGWAASRAGDHYNWDLDPYLRDGNEAVASYANLAWRVPDIINTLVPLGDDQLIFGCDHEIWMLDGDPAQDGLLVQVSRTTGMAFGKSWCLAPDGTLYFFGSRGGLYAMRGAVEPTLISDTKLPLTLRAIDLSTFRVHLEWNDELRGVHIVLIPFVETAVEAPSYFFEPSLMAFWPDTYASTDVQPTAVWLRDGDDPDDRRIMFGCQDGRVRYVDPTADTDDEDGVPRAIRGFVRMGPIMLPRDVEHAPKQVILRYIDALFSLHGGCTYRIYATDHPEMLDEPIAQGDFGPGSNDRSHLALQGRYVYIDLLASGTTPQSSHWAFESLTVGALMGGLTRAR
jgi:hypothetical protein